MFKKNEPLVPFSSRSTSSILIRSVSNSPAVAGSLKPWTWSWSTLRPRCPETMELCGFQDLFLTRNLNCKTLAFNGALFWDYEFCLAGGLVCSMQYSIVLIRLDEKDLNWLCEIWRFVVLLFWIQDHIETCSIHCFQQLVSGKKRRNL